MGIVDKSTETQRSFAGQDLFQASAYALNFFQRRRYLLSINMIGSCYRERRQNVVYVNFADKFCFEVIVSYREERLPSFGSDVLGAQISFAFNAIKKFSFGLETGEESGVFVIGIYDVETSGSFK